MFVHITGYGSDTRDITDIDMNINGRFNPEHNETLISIHRYVSCRVADHETYSHMSHFTSVWRRPADK